MKARLTFPQFRLQQAWTANAVKQSQSPLKVEGNSLEVTFKPHQIVTLRVIAGD